MLALKLGAEQEEYRVANGCFIEFATLTQSIYFMYIIGSQLMSDHCCCTCQCSKKTVCSYLRTCLVLYGVLIFLIIEAKKVRPT